MNKKQTGYNTPKAVHDTRELLLWMIPLIDKIPRVRRYTLGAKLEERLIMVLENLVSAAYSRHKRPLLEQANRDIEVARHLWRLCYDFKGISAKQYGHGSQLMLSLGMQVGGWLRTA